jgi:AcrR family transcriptional regulator
MSTPTSRSPRRDALRNRSRLVEAAARAFREQGLGVSVNAIAHDAGVNVATLYRHFPTKDDLVGAVLDALLAPLTAARDRALAGDDSADALTTFLHEAVRLQSRQRGLVDALGHRPAATDVRRRLRDPAIDIVTPLVERAHQNGELSADLDAVDVLIALRMLAAVAELAPRGGPNRYVDIVLRGLRPA